ncbi:MAG: histidine phosphatase family protein [Nocardiopsaceae bacterium]|nr:histidine phosphatase family protein [Nocardiopsaceae bacterium]
MSRRLVILRHAAAQYCLNSADHVRGLTDEGRIQARAAGAQLAQAGLVPDHVICSTALRARQTLELVLSQLPREPTIDYAESAYSANVDTIFELINAVDPEVETLLVVGHNPTMAQLAAVFVEDGGFISFSPASIAVATLEVDWLYAAPGTGTGRLFSGQ